MNSKPHFVPSAELSTVRDEKADFCWVSPLHWQMASNGQLTIIISTILVKPKFYIICTSLLPHKTAEQLLQKQLPLFSLSKLWELHVNVSSGRDLVNNWMGHPQDGWCSAAGISTRCFHKITARGQKIRKTNLCSRCWSSPPALV